MDEINELSQLHGLTATALCKALSMPRSTYYRHQKKGMADEKTVNCKPTNALDNQEKNRIIELLHSERFIDSTPYQVFYTLLDEGHYHCSIRTIYRLLAERSGVVERRNQRKHRNAVKLSVITIYDGLFVAISDGSKAIKTDP